MKKIQNILTLVTMILAFMPSCGEKHGEGEKASISSAESLNACIGQWKATGSHPLGYRHGKYAIILDILPEGTCKMSVQNDLNKTAMSDKFSDIIQLKGEWTVERGLIETKLKISSWVVTDLADYKSEEAFDDFVTTISLKDENGRLHPDNFSRDINLGTTEEAREGLTMTAKGKGIILQDVKFSRE